MELEAIYQGLIEDLNATELGKELLEKGKEILVPFLQNLALAKYKLMLGQEAEAQIVLDAMNRAISDIAAALSSHVVNHVKESIEKFIKDLLKKILFLGD